MERALQLNNSLADLIENLGGKPHRIETVDGKVVVPEELKPKPTPEQGPTKEEPKPEPEPAKEEPTKCQIESVEEKTPENPTEVAATEKIPEEPAQEAPVAEEKIEEKDEVKEVKLARFIV